MTASGRRHDRTMHSEHNPATGDEPLADAYRIVRRVAPPEAPFRARLARRDDDAVVMLVDARSLEGWRGWRAVPDGHVLAPRDLVLCADGVSVEFECCAVRIDLLLARRRHDAPLADGEAVTLAVSMLRGLAELATARPRGETSWSRGSWWMSDSGRPIFVHATEADGDRCEDADGGAARVIRAAAEQCADAALRSTLSAAADAVADWRGLDVSAVEAELFRLADAQPIDADPHAPRTIATAAGRDLPEGAGIRHEPPSRGITTLLMHGVDSSFAELVREAFDGLRQRARRARRNRPDRERRRAAPWALGGAVAALVIAGGLLWPNGEGAPPASAAPEASAGPQASAGPEASAAPERAAAGDVAQSRDEPQGRPGAGIGDGRSAPPAAAKQPVPLDLVDATDRLLERRTECGTDPACLVDVVEDPAIEFPAGVAGLGRDARRLTLLDEFGGAAVLRVDAIDGTMPSQLVVIVEQDGAWLLRDIHDVAQQPDAAVG